MEINRVDVTGPLVLVIETVVLESVVVMSTLGGGGAVRLTLPVKPFSPIRVTADVPFVPVLTDTLVGVALAPKLGTGTLIVTLMLWVRGPLVPVTVIL